MNAETVAVQKVPCVVCGGRYYRRPDGHMPFHKQGGERCPGSFISRSHYGDVVDVLDKRCPRCHGFVAYNGNYYCLDCDWALPEKTSVQPWLSSLIQARRVTRHD